LRQGLADQSVN